MAYFMVLSYFLSFSLCLGLHPTNTTRRLPLKKPNNQQIAEETMRKNFMKKKRALVFCSIDNIPKYHTCFSFAYEVFIIKG